jgi:hypothetical protein
VRGRGGHLLGLLPLRLRRLRQRRPNQPRRRGVGGESIVAATQRWKRGLAAAAVCSSLALGSAPAQAQICAEPEDIAEELYEAYLDEIGDFFPLSENACESIASTYFKACKQAVKDAVECTERQLDAIPKAAKSACKEAATNPSGCVDDFKEDAEISKDSVKEDGDQATASCEFGAAFLFNDCELPI